MVLPNVNTGDPHVAAHNDERAAINAIDARILQGTGMPEGVVSASVGTRYVDTAASNGAVEWIKFSGTGNTGWRVVYGDTGFRRNDPAATWFANEATPGADSDVGTAFRRLGDEVWMKLGLTTPAGWVNGTAFMNVPLGFRPARLTYLHGGYAGAATLQVTAGATVLTFWSGVVSNQRFMWNWTTLDPWPAPLPGIAL